MADEQGAPRESSGATVACPQCGGRNVIPSGQRVLRCIFCDSSLFVDRSGLVLHFRLPRLLDRERATAALRRWMAGNDTVKDLDRKATVEEVAAVSFPVWLFRLGRAGEEDVLIEPAAPTPNPHLADLDIPAGRLEPYRPEEGAEATAATVPIATARGWLGERADEVTEAALVHLPLWRCRYLYRGELYTALVEGSTGTVLASVFPAKAESPYYLTFAAALLLFGAEGLLISDPLWKLAAYLLTGVPLAVVAYLVARKV